MLFLICAPRIGAGFAARGSTDHQGHDRKTSPARRCQFRSEKATDAYLAQVSGKARAQSDSYFEGGYVLLFVDALYAVLVSALLLWLRISAAMRNFAQGITRSRFWQVPIYVFQYVIVAGVATFPLTLYEEFFREHAYGLSNQTFLAWLGDFATGFGVDLLAMMIFLTVIYAIIRGSRRLWWLWGSIIAVVFLAIAIMIIAGVHRAAVQSLLAAEGWAGQNADTVAGARQSHSGRQCL